MRPATGSGSSAADVEAPRLSFNLLRYFTGASLAILLAIFGGFSASTAWLVREAARFDPGNARLVERLRALERRAAAGDPTTVPLTLEEERATNPFFRWDDREMLERLGTPPGRPAFRRLCELL